MEGEAAVGRRVRVFWEGEDEWFEGVVTAFAPESGYFVRYDDGEEQWEQTGDALVFLSSDADAADQRQELETDAIDAEAGEPAMPSPSYSEQEFEDDGGSEADDDQRDDRGLRSSPVSARDVDPLPSRSADNEMIEAAHPGQRKPATARALMGGSAPFFRDEETLREMKRTLETEKRELEHAKAALETQLADRERESTAIRRELQRLKSQVSLTSALHYSSSSSSCSQSSTSLTTAEWKLRAFDLKLGNQQLQHDVVELKTEAQSLQPRVREQEQRVQHLRAKVDRVPKRELLSLVELQVEIAQLLQRKREMEAAARAGGKRNPRQPRATDDGTDEVSQRTALEKQLARLELSITQSQEDARSWRTRLECERARLQPMSERLASLRAELAQHHSNDKSSGGKSVLLRSLFLRLDGDQDAIVDRKAAMLAIAQVLGSSGDGEEPEATAVTSDDDSQQLTFDQFADMYYQCLATRSEGR